MDGAYGWLVRGRFETISASADIVGVSQDLGSNDFLEVCLADNDVFAGAIWLAQLKLDDVLHALESRQFFRRSIEQLSSTTDDDSDHFVIGQDLAADIGGTNRLL